MSWLSKALGLSSSQNPANAAQPYLQQIPGVGHQYYDPYIQQGQQAGQTLQSEYGKQLDPTTFLNELQKGYKPSESYQFRKDDLMKEMAAVAGQGGYAGTPMAQRQYGEQANRILSEDQQQYLQNALGIYGQGISGEQDFYNKGYGASGNMADLLGGALNQQGGLAFQGQSQQNTNRQALIRALAQALGLGAGAAMNPAGAGANVLGGI